MITPEKFGESLSELAKSRGFSARTVCEVSGYPILAFERKAVSSAATPNRVYLSSGVHGDEPAGPLALAHLLENDLLPTHVEILIVPFINPTGFAKQTRESAEGHDLNRDFRYPQNPETAAVKDLIDSQPPFHLSLALHEDWESDGFYMYSLSADSDSRPAREILKAVEKTGPIDTASEIDGSPATGGLIDRPADFDIDGRDDWPESFLLYSKSRHDHYTLETSSSAPIEQRIAQHAAAVLSAIEIHCP